jgi:hypothetical protein
VTAAIAQRMTAGRSAREAADDLLFNPDSELPRRRVPGLGVLVEPPALPG